MLPSFRSCWFGPSQPSYNLHRLGQPAHLEREINGHRLIDVAVLPTKTAFLNPCFSTVNRILPYLDRIEDVSSAIGRFGGEHALGGFVGKRHDGARNDGALFVNDGAGYARAVPCPFATALRQIKSRNARIGFLISSSD